MKISKVKSIPDLLIVQPTVFEDNRGYFYEVFNQNDFSNFGLDVTFVQDNCSKSSKNVLRGLHYQTGEHAQAKLVRVTEGSVWDVAVDIRKNSPTFGQHFGIELNEQNKTQLYIPKGFAHGFLVLSDYAVFNYKCDNFYNKESEGGILWNDEELAIQWPKPSDVGYELSEKDTQLPSFKNARPVE